MDQPTATPGAAAPVAGHGPWLLEVEDLHVHFVTTRGVVRAVEGISYKVQAGRDRGARRRIRLRQVGVVARHHAAAREARRAASSPAASCSRAANLLELTEDQMREIRGRDIAMIFQEPMTSLNPVLTIGFQIMEPLLIHLGMATEAARARAVELLQMVGIPDAERRLDQYPHQFSGGMRQRVMIAIALSCNPKLDHRRRADHRARRHDPGADPEADEGPVARPRHRAGGDHPQPRHRRALRRPRERDVRRAHGGAGDGRRRVRQAAASLYRRAAALGAAARPAARPEARDHRRPAAQPARPAAGLPLRAALPGAAAEPACRRRRR